MIRIAAKSLLAALLLSAAIFSSACGEATSKASSPALPVATEVAADAEGSDQTIRFLEDRVRRDKDDFIALNKLAASYLQRLRETGNIDYLELSAKAARASLDVMPKQQNVGGLATLAQVEFASHHFAVARDYAGELIKLDPGKGYPAQLLADSLLELGDYEKAAAVLKELQRQSQSASLEIRLSRWALLRGDTQEARERLSKAILLSQNQRVPSRETLAWLRWQLGEVYFSTGDFENAGKTYADALTIFPNYYRAIAGLGRVQAAKGDWDGAIESYERVTRILPEPSFIAVLGDLYKVAGREPEAAAQYALIEQIGKIGKANGSLYNRQIALFYADHDLKVEEAYAQAKAEYDSRKDIYGADAVAWTALKAGKIEEAQTAIKEALRLGTRDARLFYHAGRIARAAGDTATARDYLQRALSVNSQFDALQAAQARQALESLK